MWNPNIYCHQYMRSCVATQQCTYAATVGHLYTYTDTVGHLYTCAAVIQGRFA